MLNKSVNIEQEEYRAIEDYLDSKLSEIELLVFEKRLNEDSKWKEKVDEVKFLRDGIERTAMKFRLHKFHNEMPVQETIQRSLNPSWIWSVAASLLFIIGALGWWSGWYDSNSNRLFEAYYVKDPGLTSVMSSSDNYEFDRGMVEYKSGDYAKSLDFWVPLLDQRPENDTLLYLVAMNHLELGELQKGQNLLEQVIQMNESYFNQDAYWYLGLIKVKEDQFDEAIPYLKASERVEANSLISKLEKDSK